jgi:predicted SAM-dependent methyltransferase
MESDNSTAAPAAFPGLASPQQQPTQIPPPPHGGMLLHIGGKVRKKGWTVVNITAGPHVDIVADAKNLEMLPDAGCSVVYASHILEHLGHNDGLPQALAGFFRVLMPGGHLLVSVPDLDVLCRLFIDPQLSVQERFFVMHMMFGARGEPYDFHLSGLNVDILGTLFVKAGFRSFFRVPDFGLFEDTSTSKFKGLVPISLNMVAIKKVG